MNKIHTHLALVKMLFKATSAFWQLMNICTSSCLKDLGSGRGEARKEELPGTYEARAGRGLPGFCPAAPPTGRKASDSSPCGFRGQLSSSGEFLS